MSVFHIQIDTKSVLYGLLMEMLVFYCYSTHRIAMVPERRYVCVHHLELDSFHDLKRLGFVVFPYNVLNKAMVVWCRCDSVCVYDQETYSFYDVMCHLNRKDTFMSLFSVVINVR